MDGDNWFVKNWRPALAWSYLVICMFDFMFGSIFLGVYCAYYHIPYIPWDPLTLKGGQVYHVAMGGILGVTAWSRGREKIAAMEEATKTPRYAEGDTDSPDSQKG